MREKILALPSLPPACLRFISFHSWPLLIFLSLSAFFWGRADRWKVFGKLSTVSLCFTLPRPALLPLCSRFAPSLLSIAPSLSSLVPFPLVSQPFAPPPSISLTFNLLALSFAILSFPPCPFFRPASSLLWLQIIRIIYLILLINLLGLE